MLTVLAVDNIDYEDCPEFCDAFISKAEIDGKLLTDEELDELNDSMEPETYEEMINFIIQSKT